MPIPKVSILLTVYNIKKEYLDQCIRSILQQSFKDYEILIIDDASADDYSYLRKLSPKIRYFRNQVNMGMCRSVNTLLLEAKGDYIVRLGSDDYFHNDLLATEVFFLDSHPDYIACCCNLVKCKGLRRIRVSRPLYWDLKKILAGAYKHTGYAGGMMFRKKAIDKGCRIDVHYPVCEDFAFHLELLKLGKIHSILEDYYFYRKHDTNLTNQSKLEDRKRLIWKIIDNFKARYAKELR